MNKEMITVKVKSPLGRTLSVFKKYSFLYLAYIDVAIPRYYSNTNKIKYNVKKNTIKVYTCNVVREHAKEIKNHLIYSGYTLVK